MEISITTISRTQKQLRNPSQIPAMIRNIVEGLYLPPVLLAELPDGTILLEDGHHRCLGYWLAGRTGLAPGEFVLVQREHSRRPSYGPIATILR